MIITRKIKYTLSIYWRSYAGRFAWSALSKFVRKTMGELESRWVLDCTGLHKGFTDLVFV